MVVVSLTNIYKEKNKMSIIIYREIVAITHAENRVKKLTSMGIESGEVTSLLAIIDAMYDELKIKLDRISDKNQIESKCVKAFRSQINQRLETKNANRIARYH